MTAINTAKNTKRNFVILPPEVFLNSSRVLPALEFFRERTRASEQDRLLGPFGCLHARKTGFGLQAQENASGARIGNVLYGTDRDRPCNRLLLKELEGGTVPLQEEN
jgi:hypothetical protein